MLYAATPLEIVELKAADAGDTVGEFTAYASTFGNEDLGGDVIESGAFKRTLRERSFRPLLWHHDMSEVIGKELQIKEDGKGLLGTWKLLPTQRGREAYLLMKEGAVRSMSIGYVPSKFEFVDGGIGRKLKDVELFENSVVSLPMNEQARVQRVKELFCSMCQAIYEAKDATDMQHNHYNEMNLIQLGEVVREVLGLFSERTGDLVRKLSSGEHELTDAKRNDLTALLEMFSGVDAVRTDAETLLRVKSAAEVDESAPPEEVQPSVSAIALAIQMRKTRQRARELGVIR